MALVKVFFEANVLRVNYLDLTLGIYGEFLNKKR
jgi:hypothetical protein